MREATLTIVITENENGGGDLPDSAENLYLQWGPHSDLKCYADREESKEGWHVESVSVEELDASKPDKDREGDDVLQEALQHVYAGHLLTPFGLALKELCRRALEEGR